ncbi:menaquinol oxidoreductase [candidate division LCP-89 bacterium B3_LCP]|uniref:Menaquinol oxidoreductase n=1 Tax=candidate division LCP-89 bacterium B3_LCP TaxID=2012998 RepID=A0A532V0S0_UNCL8|nr:MAG: menaquinol oxidoreductase [candidate division LCP-89 bacterium B3_LCP]
MIEKALQGGKAYWTLVIILLAIVGVGTLAYLKQFTEGLTVTGLSRDVSWGLYIAQFTFMVGVAASAVMVVLPYYIHNYKKFGKITILGEFLAIASCVMCMTFIFVDMGQPFRILNVFLHPSPNSLMFWDTVVLFGYLVLNLLISWTVLGAEKKGIAPPKWIKPIIIISIPWAVSIHTVTAFLYSGLAARPFWMTAVLAPRFLASAFSAGPALLIIFCLILRKYTKFDVGREPIQKLAVIVTYAMLINVFLILMEVFTAMYSGIPEHLDHFKYMFFGMVDAEGILHTNLVPWMWLSACLGVLSVILLVVPKFRMKEGLLALACIFVFFSLWIDKGMGMIVAGFTPNPSHGVFPYTPTFIESMITLGVWGLGALIVTVLYKVALTLRKQVDTNRYRA